MVLAVDANRIRTASSRGHHAAVPCLVATTLGLEDVPSGLVQSPATLVGALGAKFREADVFGAQPLYLYGQFRFSQEVQEFFNEHPVLIRIRKRLREAHSAYLGVGSVNIAETASERGYFARLIVEAFEAQGSSNPAHDARNALSSAGAVGEIVNIPFDQDGQTCLGNQLEPLRKRLIRLFPDEENDLIAIKKFRLAKIAVAGGKSKATAVRAAVEGRLVDTLITDAACARAILYK